jgi:hypothetical protein
VSTASRRTEAGGAHYHVLVATAKWKAFRESEQHEAIHTAAERARNDERRRDAEPSVHAAGQS